MYNPLLYNTLAGLTGMR